MTDTTLELIKILKQNARTPLEDIARMLNVTVKKVAAMIEKLEADGVILQYTAVTNDELIPGNDASIRALIKIKVAPQKRAGFDAVAQRICRYDNVVSHYLVSGDYDFLVIVEGNSLQEISAFVSDKLASIEHVVSTATHFIMKKYKESGVMLERPNEDARLAVSA